MKTYATINILLYLVQDTQPRTQREIVNAVDVTAYVVRDRLKYLEEVNWIDRDETMGRHGQSVSCWRFATDADPDLRAAFEKIARYCGPQ